MKQLYLLLFIPAVLLVGCDLANLDNEALTEAEIVEGLKEALRVGTDTASSEVSKEDGYFKDQAIKLLLPDELENSIETFKSKSIDLGFATLTGKEIYTTGVPELNIEPLQSKEDDLVLGINRAAESAAKDAAPVFWNAISGMTIADGKTILFSENDTAATGYLNDNTRPQLFDNYEPKIDDALKSVKIGNTVIVDEYEGFVSDYNGMLNTEVDLLLTTVTIKELAEMDTVGATDLSAYSTDKGLNGLFLKVGEQEKKIREDPVARVTEILQKVFGELDE